MLIALLSIIRNRVTKGNRSRNKGRPEAAFYILGQIDEVFQFDKARKCLRASPNNITVINTYTNILPIMESKISQKQTKIKQQLKNLEHQYFEKTGKLLTSQLLTKDPKSKLLMDKMKYCKALVTQWKREKK